MKRSEWPEVCLSPECAEPATLCLTGRDGGIIFGCLDCLHTELEVMMKARVRMNDLENDGCHPKLAERRALEEFYPDGEEDP
jgi:hypothetical protein